MSRKHLPSTPWRDYHIPLDERLTQLGNDEVTGSHRCYIVIVFFSKNNFVGSLRRFTSSPAINKRMQRICMRAMNKDTMLYQLSLTTFSNSNYSSPCPSLMLTPQLALACAVHFYNGESHLLKTFCCKQVGKDITKKTEKV